MDKHHVFQHSLKHESQFTRTHENTISERSLLTLPPVPHHLPLIPLNLFWEEHLSIFQVICIT